MARVRREDDGLRLTLEETEADAVRGLLAQLADLVRDGDTRDPVLGRLFPDTYDDAAEQEAYADVVGDSLRSSTLDVLAAVRARLGEAGTVDVGLDDEGAEHWLIALTELRLALGTRLRVDESTMEADLDPDDPRAPALSLLRWLGWIQEATLTSLS